VDSAPVLVARKRGFFDKEGLNVEIRLFSSGKEALAAVLRREADIATVADLPITAAVLDGADHIRILATICKSGRENSIVARRDRGIGTPGQFRGKTVGVIPGTTSEYMLDEFLMLHGIPRSAITVVPMGPEETVAAMTAGRVDAVSTWSQYTATLLKRLGSNGARFFSEESYQMYWNVVTTREFAAGNGDTLQRVIAALDDANGSIAKRNDEARQVVMETFQLDGGQMEALWPDYEFDLSLDQSLILTLENQARWMLRRRGTPAAQLPNFREQIYLDALAGISPATVTVIR
jgi:NitT/TauT family transport system substrate-binding protein